MAIIAIHALSGRSTGANAGVDYPPLTLESQITSDEHDELLVALAFSPDGQTLATLSTADGVIKFWDVAARKVKLSFSLSSDGRGVTGEAGALAYHPSGRFLGILIGQRMYVLTLDDMKSIGPLPGEITAFSFAPNGEVLGTVLAAGEDGVFVDVWLMSDLQRKSYAESQRYKFPGHRAEIAQLAFAQGDDVIALASSLPEDEIGSTVWNRTWVWRNDFVPADAPVVAASPDGMTLLVGHRILTFREVDPFRLDGIEVARLQGVTSNWLGRLYGAAFSSDGQWIVAMSFGMLRVYDARTGAELGFETLLLATPLTPAVAPDGRVVALGFGGSVAFVTVSAK